MPELFPSADPEEVPDLDRTTAAPPAGLTHPAQGSVPLAERMRPRRLEDYAGQQHILGPGKLLRRALESGRFTSLIFSGPPGTGKTTLAELIARASGLRLVRLSGVTSNVAEIRAAVDEARTRQRLGGDQPGAHGTLLFIDEIHRLNAAQQDVLLPHVERGTVRLIGATTHNPYHSVNAALVSRSQLFQLESLDEADLIGVIHRALADPDQGFGRLPIQLDPDAAALLASKAEGDARKALTALELAVLTTPPGADGTLHLTLEVAAESIQQRALVYDRAGDAHYDTISAFIKSIRGSDPDAALYWLAKMILAGEDPRFIARRLVISASEDIGLADSHGLRVACDAFEAVEKIGLPEARINLAHATVYLATAPKSNRSYAAYEAAAADLKANRSLAVPVHLRGKTRKKLAEQTGHVSVAELNYHYAHDAEDGYIPQAYLPEGRRYYFPSQNGLEARIAERLEHWRQRFAASQTQP